MDIKVKIGEHDVVASGSVVGNPQTPIQFDFQGLTMRLCFEVDGENKEKRVNVTNQTTTFIELTFYNFDNPTGTGNTTPILLGTSNGKELFFNYRIYALNGEVGKLVHYTFYV